MFKRVHKWQCFIIVIVGVYVYKAFRYLKLNYFVQEIADSRTVTHEFWN